MKLFKQLTLLLTSLLAVAFSFSFSKANNPSTSLQDKSIEYHLTALAVDDIDDDFVDPEFQIIYNCEVLSVARPEQSLSKIVLRSSNRSDASIPFYLQVRNLRI